MRALALLVASVVWVGCGGRPGVLKYEGDGPFCSGAAKVDVGGTIRAGVATARLVSSASGYVVVVTVTPEDGAMPLAVRWGTTSSSLPLTLTVPSSGLELVVGLGCDPTRSDCWAPHQLNSREYVMDGEISLDTAGNGLRTNACVSVDVGTDLPYVRLWAPEVALRP